MRNTIVTTEERVRKLKEIRTYKYNKIQTDFSRKREKENFSTKLLSFHIHCYSREVHALWVYLFCFYCKR